MASITAVDFDQAVYAPGDVVRLTVTYVPDTPSVVPTPFTATVTLNDPSGNVLATQDAQATVNVPQAGDTVAVTDSGSRTWTQDSDNGATAVFTAVA